MEACGLKYSIINGRYQDKMSRLMEACGLKCLVHALLLGLGLLSDYLGQSIHNVGYNLVYPYLLCHIIAPPSGSNFLLHFTVWMVYNISRRTI